MSIGLSREEIIRLLEKGFTKTEVAELYSTSINNVNYHLNKTGEPYLTPRQRAMQHIPWNVRPEHKDSTPYQRLRAHVKLVALGKKRVTADETKRLRAWYKEMNDLDVVVEYDPTIPPTPNASKGGWRYVPREERDGDLLVRVNKYAKMSDEAYVYFRRPTKLP